MRRSTKRKRTTVGPRGGATTVTTAGLVRKTVYFDPDEWRAIRREGLEKDLSCTEIVRRAVRRALGMQEPDQRRRANFGNKGREGGGPSTRLHGEKEAHDGGAAPRT
jgi:hypothetical protein